MRDIAESLGVTIQTVAGWECGGTPSTLNLSAYVDLLESLAVYESKGSGT